MYKFHIGQEVEITGVSEYCPKVYYAGKRVIVKKRDFKEGFDPEPLY